MVEVKKEEIMAATDNLLGGRKFQALTCRLAIEKKMLPSFFHEGLEGMPQFNDWNRMIQVANYTLVEGDPLSLDSGVFLVLTAAMQALGSDFL